MVAGEVDADRRAWDDGRSGEDGCNGRDDERDEAFQEW